MIFHSIIPSEEVMKGFDEFKPIFKDVTVGGVQMQVTPLGMGRGRIERLLSTDPEDYLRTDFQPGSLISWPLEPES